jgi:hypothetical protein
MRKGILGAVAAPILIAALTFAVPAVSHGARGRASTDCVQSSPKPTPRGNVNDLPDGGKAYAYPAPPSTQTTGEAGVVGPHGWLVAKGDGANQTGSISGRASDVPVNGYIKRDATGNPSICLSVEGQKVTAP